jgi:hypothetical protein
MKTISAPRPTSMAIVPFAIESAPSSALIELSSTTVRSTGSAPERSAIASWLALSTVKLPEICAVPPMIGSLMLGAEMTSPSRMIANGLPTFSLVSRANARRPAGRTGCDDRLVGLRVEGLLRVGQRIAADAAEPRTAIWCRVVAAAGAGHDLAARRGDALGDVRLQRGLVDQLELELGGLAEQVLERLRVLEPGTSTTMRSSPSRMIVGSRVPSASMRLRTTSVALSIALSTASRARPGSA